MCLCAYGCCCATQVTVDWRGKIRHLKLGVPGSQNDITIFRHSSLYMDSDDVFRNVHGGLAYTCIGDKGYRGEPDIIHAPQTDAAVRNSPNPAEARALNRTLCSERVFVEMVIGVVKTNWRMCAYGFPCVSARTTTACFMQPVLCRSCTGSSQIRGYGVVASFQPGRCCFSV